MKMDRAYRMRATHSERERSIQHPVTDERIQLGENDRTLDEIFNNREEEGLFINHFLPAQNATTAEAIVEARASKRPFTEDEEKFLEKSRLEYNTRRAELDLIRERLTPEEVAQMSELDPRIERIAGAITKERTAEFLLGQIGELAMRDANAFHRIAESLKAVTEIRNSDEAAASDARVAETLRKYGMSEETFNTITAARDPQEAQEKLAEEAGKQLQGFKKALDFVTFGAVSKHRAGALYESYEEQQRLLSECDTHLSAIAKVLNKTITEEARVAIYRAAFEGGSVEEKRAENVVSIKDYLAKRSEQGDSAIEARFKAELDAVVVKEKFTDKNAKTKKWDDLSPAQKTELNPKVDAVKIAFVKKEKERRDGYKGRGLLITLLTRSSKDDAAIRTQIDAIAA